MADGELVVRRFGWEPPARMTDLANRPNPDERLSEAAAALVFAGVPENTRKTYRVQWWKFVRWCGETGREHLPATPATVIEYMNHLWRTPARYGRPTAPASVRLAMSVIAVAHKQAKRPEVDSADQPYYGYVPPTEHPLVQRAFRGYTRQWLDAGHRPDKAYALSADEVALMVGTLDLRTAAGRCDAALLTIGFDLGGRRGEMAYLNIGDVELYMADPAGAVQVGDWIDVTIARSKTDQAGRGATIRLYAHPPYDAVTCPVRAARAWLPDLHGAGHTSGAMFRVVLVVGKGPAGGGPRTSVILEDRIDPQRLATVVERTANAAGITVGPDGKTRHITPHSLRRGSASASAGRGAGQAALNHHYRWSMRGTTANEYVDVAQGHIENPMRRVYEKRAEEHPDGRSG